MAASTTWPLPDVVEGRAGVEQVGAAVVLVEHAHGAEGVEHRHQHGRTVDHGSIDHLPFAGLLRLQQRAHHAEGQEHAAAAEVADQVQRRHGTIALAPDHMQHAGERDVVDVVAGIARHRPVLAESRHAADHELGVELLKLLGRQPQALQNAGTEALDQRIGLGCQFLDDGASRLGLEIDRQRAAAAMQDIVLRLAAWQTEIGRLPPIDADHLGAHVGEQRGRKRRRADARHLDDAKTGQWSHRGYLSVAVCRLDCLLTCNLRAISLSC